MDETITGFDSNRKGQPRTERATVADLSVLRDESTPTGGEVKPGEGGGLFQRDEELRAKPPIEVTGVEKRRFTAPDLRDAVSAARVCLRAWFAANKFVDNADTGLKITSSRNYIDHATHLGHENIRAHLEAAGIMPDLLRRGVEVERYRGTKETNRPDLMIHRLAAPAEIDGRLYRVLMTVKEFTEKGRRVAYYDHGLTELKEVAPATERAKAGEPGIGPSFRGRSISEPDLLRGASRNDGRPFFGEGETGFGRSQGNPAPTPEGSTRPGTIRQPEFRPKLTKLKIEVKMAENGAASRKDMVPH